VKVLVDMNLSPSWIAILERHGFPAVHWSAVGKGCESDSVVLGWARENDYLVFTHDLDFGAILASTNASGPSVIQVRTQDVSPGHLGEILVRALREYQEILVQGALITIDESRLRARILPLVR
jgi:predicted nuclease of predicted toxin-antitoxin system